MRLWSIHPKYLDSKGLVALWRETLLAKKVLKGKTRGYKNHPQLERFKTAKNPNVAINKYLFTILKEANHRKYNFDKEKVEKVRFCKRIPVNNEQIKYEFQHLLAKLGKRDLEKFDSIKYIEDVEVNPIFEIVDGKIETWEKV